MAANVAKLRKLFPAEWSTRLLTVKEIQDGDLNGFVIEARIALNTKDQFSEWMKRHEKLARVTYKLLKNYPTAGKYVVFKSEYVCTRIATSNKSKGEKVSKKLPSCPSKLLVRIRSLNSKYRSRKLDESRFPCTVVLYHLHNHSIDSITFQPKIQHEDVLEEVKQKFREMFKGGFSLPVALSTHQSDLLEEYADEYEEILTDRFICPDMEWLTKFYADFVQEFGDCTDQKMLNNLENAVSEYNIGDGKAKMLVVDDNVIVALCTPIMQRAHSLKSAGEIVFLDSSGLMDRCKCYVYALMAYSCAEGLPLGILITTSDSESVLTTALQLFIELLPNKAFGQNGKRGPEMFLTANSDAEQNSVRSAFPESNLLLCSFHMLQIVWGWLWDRENNIDAADRCILFSLTFNIMKAKNAQDFTKCFASTLQDKVVAKYPHFKSYFQELSGMSAKWAVCFKNEIVDKDKEISSVEMASHILKDKVFLNRAYNIVQLFNFFTGELELYYKQKIIHCIGDTLEAFLQSSYKPEMRMIDDLTVSFLPSGQYQVLNTKSNRSYYVEMNIGVCSCALGMIGSRCKHQYAVCVLKNSDLTSLVPDDGVIRKELYWIATNSLDVPVFNSWDPGSSDSEAQMDVHTYDEEESMELDFRNVSNSIRKQTGTESLKAEAKSILNRMVEDIMKKFDSDPNSFHSAIKGAYRNYQKLNSGKDIANALRAFAHTDQSVCVQTVTTNAVTSTTKTEPQNPVLPTSSIQVQQNNVLLQANNIQSTNIPMQTSNFQMQPSSVLMPNSNVVLLPYNLQLLPSNVAQSSNVLILPENCQMLSNKGRPENSHTGNVRILPKPAADQSINEKEKSSVDPKYLDLQLLQSGNDQQSNELILDNSDHNMHKEGCNTEEAENIHSVRSVSVESPNTIQILPDELTNSGVQIVAGDIEQSTNLQVLSGDIQPSDISMLSDNIELSGNIQSLPDAVTEQATSFQILTDNVGQQATSFQILSDNIEQQSTNILVLSENVSDQSANVHMLPTTMEQPTNVFVIPDSEEQTASIQILSDGHSSDIQMLCDNISESSPSMQLLSANVSEEVSHMQVLNDSHG